MNRKQKLYKYYEYLVNPLYSKVMLVFYTAEALSQCIYHYLYASEQRKEKSYIFKKYPKVSRT
jgi:hypothetical protein